MVGKEYKSMTREDLRHACDARALNSDGTKSELVKKLTVGQGITFIGLLIDRLMECLTG